MKMLMFGMSSYPGGTENYIRNIFFHHTCSSKMQIDFITYEEDLAYSNEMEALGYRVLRVPHLKRHPIGYFKEVARLMKQQKYDALYVNMLCAANPLPVFFAKVCKVPRIILHAHSNSTIKGLVRGFLHRTCKRYCDKAATLRLACSGAAAEWLFNTKNTASPIEVIPNAINSEKYSYSFDYRMSIREKYGIKENELLLGSVGRFGPEKNNIFMIEILEQLMEKGVTAKLMLVGDGGLRPVIEQRVRDKKLENSVVLTGTVIDPYQYYSAFDCFLFPSSFEGFGISALEAQACGLQCFCSDTLSRELDVTKTVAYLPLSNGAEYWAEMIHKSDMNLNHDAMNKRVQDSAYNIEKQREHVLELVYGK